MRTLHTLLLSAVAITAVAQSSQPGLVQEYRGAQPKTPLPQVMVTASNAGAVMSDADGRFTLSFRTLKWGDAIQFRRIELSGYEVMNQEALDVARVARPSADQVVEPLHIVLAPREVLRQLREGYRSVAVERYEKQLHDAEAEAERLRQQGQLDEAAYNERMDALEEEYEEKLSKLESYIDKFARIDLSDLDQDEQQIVALVQDGKFEEALARYDSQNLSERLRQSRADREKLVSARDQLAAAERQKAIENQRLRQSIDRQVTLLRMAGGEENLLKAHRILHQTFLADTTDVQARREYAFSLELFRQTDEQLRVLLSGIASCDDQFQRSLLLLEVADAYWLQEDYDQTLVYLRQAEATMLPIQQTDYQVNTRALPALTDVMLRYYLRDEEDVNACRPFVERMRQCWQPDTLVRQSMVTYSTLLSDMGTYYSRTNNHEQSLWATRRSLEFGHIIEDRWPWLSPLFESYASAATIFGIEGQIPEARHAARQCTRRLTERIDKSGSVSTLADACASYFSLAEALSFIGDYALTDSIMQTAEERHLYERALAYQSDLNQLYVTLCRYYHAQALFHLGRSAEAEPLAQTALQDLMKSEEGEALSQTLRPLMLALIAQSKGEYAEAIARCQEAIAVGRAAYDESRDAWDADALCRMYIQLAEVYKAQGDKKNMQKTLKQARKFAVFQSDEQIIKGMKK